MRNFDLNFLGVQEMNIDEKKLISGGNVLIWVGLLLLGDALLDPSASASALENGFNSTNRH